MLLRRCCNADAVKRSRSRSRPGKRRHYAQAVSVSEQVRSRSRSRSRCAAQSATRRLVSRGWATWLPALRQHTCRLPAAGCRLLATCQSSASGDDDSVVHRHQQRQALTTALCRRHRLPLPSFARTPHLVARTRPWGRDRKGGVTSSPLHPSLVPPRLFFALCRITMIRMILPSAAWASSVSWAHAPLSSCQSRHHDFHNAVIFKAVTSAVTITKNFAAFALSS